MEWILLIVAGVGNRGVALCGGVKQLKIGAEYVSDCKHIAVKETENGKAKFRGCQSGSRCSK